MNSRASEPLEKRIAGLEANSRRDRRIFGMVSVVMLICLVSGQSTKPAPTTIEAQRFVLRDSKGETRAILGFEDADEQNMGLFLMVPGDELGASLTVRNKPSAACDLRLVTGYGESVSFTARQSTSAMSIYGPAGNLAFRSDFGAGNPYLGFNIDGQGIGSLRYSASRNDQPKLEFERKGLASEVSSGPVYATSKSFFGVTPNKRSVMKLAIDDRGLPSIGLYDLDGRLRTAIGATDPQNNQNGDDNRPVVTSFKLFAEDGRISWQVP